MSESITTPVGRFVEGNLYRGSNKDANGQPIFYKNGPKKGQPLYNFYFALAIAKGSETHWNQTEWGKVIDRVAKTDFSKGEWQRPDFAWKVKDGDSIILNKAQRRPCDKEGFPGHWILNFSRPSDSEINIPYKFVNRDGSKQLIENNEIHLGDYGQVHTIVAGNSNLQNPGIYLNQVYVALTGPGDPIIIGPQADSVGFGQAALPPGVRSVPSGSFNPEPASQFTQAELTQQAAPPPYPQILNAPPPAKVMLPKANGLTYEQYKSSGWTDEQLVQNGLMSP